MKSDLLSDNKQIFLHKPCVRTKKMIECCPFLILPIQLSFSVYYVIYNIMNSISYDKKRWMTCCTVLCFLELFHI